MLCEDFSPKLMLVNDCELKVRTNLDPFETKFFLITPELDALSVPPTQSKFVSQAELKNDAWTMNLSRSSNSKSLTVEIFKTKGGKITNKNVLNVTLGYYKTYLLGEYNSDSNRAELHSSGHYAFSTTQKEPLPFCEFKEISEVRGEAVNQIHAYYSPVL